MPIFDVQCGNCGFSWEELMSSRKDVVFCPECGKNEIDVLPSLPSRVHIQRDAYDRFLHKRPPDDPIKATVPKNYRSK